MYLAPIELETMISDISHKIADDTGAHICEAVMNVGINVRRSELIMALAYDRQQYVQGYRDGKADATRTGRWITVRSANSPRARRMCSECKSIDIHRASPFCPQCGAKMIKKKELQL